MSKEMSVEQLWGSVTPSESTHAGASPELIEPARRYLDHALPVGARLPDAVRLEMHGEIDIGKYFPFEAEQVIVRERGMIWAATVRIFGLPIRGSDRVVDGQGLMRWKLLGFIPIVNDSSPDVTRSALGRMAAELVWLPSALARPDVKWTAGEGDEVHAGFELEGESIDLCLTLDADGSLKAFRLERWGQPPEGPRYAYCSFGGFVEEHGTFDGYRIPTRLRVGWYAGTADFEKKGEFIRVTVDRAEFR